MKTSTTCLIFATMQFFIVGVVSDTMEKLSDATGQSQLTSEIVYRNPKFLHFLKQIFGNYPTTLSDFVGPNKGKYGNKNEHQVVNYDQYFVNADPYNQNQLLSAKEAEKGPMMTLDMAGSEYVEGGVVEGDSSGSGINSINTLFTKLIGDDTTSPSSIISNILSLGTGSMEKVLQRVNAFDSLKCIPRLLCQTVAQRQVETMKNEVTTSTARPKSRVKTEVIPGVTPEVTSGFTSEFTSSLTSRVTQQDTSRVTQQDTTRVTQQDTSRVTQQDTSRITPGDTLRVTPEVTSGVKPYIPSRHETFSNFKFPDRDAKTIKFLGVETALAQFMAFLDLVQLKNWSLYPYLKGAYEGAQVKRLDECAQRFETCPFSDQQLVYYFNNYNGGFFQAFQSK